MTCFGLGKQKQSRPNAVAMAAGKYGLKRSGRLWWVEFFGILHCVQDDSRNLQRQNAQLGTAETCNGKCAVGNSRDLQRHVRSWGQRRLATASAQLGAAETCNGKCAVGDSGNLQRQVRSWGQRKLATASAQLGTAETCNGKCAVGDSRDLRRQVRSWGQRKLAMADSDARQVRSWGCGMDWVRGGFLRGSHQA
jgi:hypothetical protein